MTAHTVKIVTIIALAGTSLSGCAFLGGAADTVWSGTKSFANFMVTPVGELLRPAPEETIQFAATDAEDTVATIEKTEMTETKVANAVETSETDTVWRKLEVKTDQSAEISFSDLPAAEMSQTFVEVETAPIAAATKTVSYENGLRTETFTQSFETVSMDQSRSLQVMQGEDSAFIHMEGGTASLNDWRTCEERAGGYWSFDGTDVGGRLNPQFERCMTSQDYTMKTTVKTDIIPASNPVTVTQTSTLP